MFLIDFKISLPCMKVMRELTDSSVHTEGAVSGYLLLRCGENHFGYMPESTAEGGFWGDCNIDDWFRNLLSGLEVLERQSEVGIADPENFANILYFRRVGEKVEVSLLKANTRHIIVNSKPDEAQRVWESQTSFAELKAAVLQGADKLSREMLQLNRRYESSKAWKELMKRVEMSS